MFIIVILISAWIIMILLGHLAHMAFHQKWAGIFHQAHLNHHNIQYPPSDMLSEKYRNAGTDNTTIYFAIIFSPLIIGNILLTIFGIVPIIIGVGIFLEMLTVSLLNIFIHDALHITNGFWHRFKFFKNLQKLHFVHHIDQTKNFGIFNFFWDKAFGTYEE
jgi:sterol desaturase/sphingolipid hydroxylase (fatty acid hydroxylase superfamily)